MAERDLKHYGRKELIDLLYESEKKNAELRKQLESEQEKNKKLNESLESRKLDVTEAGNLAEAALKVNGIYEAAQKAADDYLMNIKNLTSEQDRIIAEREEESKKKASQMIKNASRECASMQKKAEEECWELEEQTRIKCDEIKATAKLEVESYWKELSVKLEEFYQSHQGMRELMGDEEISVF